MTLELPDNWLTLITALIPFLAAAGVRREGSNLARTAIAIGASALVALASQITDSDPDTFAELVGTFVTAVVVQLASYQTLGKALRINDRLVPKVGI